MESKTSSAEELSDRIWLPGSESSPQIKTRFLLFFITGNPGLIGYYNTFLSYLWSLLHSENRCSSSEIAYDVYGASLVGFELEKLSAKPGHPTDSKYSPPFSLKEVIAAVEADLERVISATRRSGETLKVILMGHSVGSYIALEVLQRYRRRIVAGCSEAHIASVMCLFPTVVDIAKSERGKVLSALSRIPHFHILVSLFCKFLMLIIPNFLVNAIASAVTNPTAGPVTAAFLKSKHGVKQALFMGADEMWSITKDEWDEEVWGTATSPEHGVSRPKLYFYFGENDHWVAESTRDDLMKIRGPRNGETWRPSMEVDAMGIPHGFCISHSRPVAEKVAQYVQHIIDTETGSSPR